MAGLFITLLVVGDIAASTGAIYSTSKMVREYINDYRQESFRKKIQTDRDQSLNMAWEDLLECTDVADVVDVANADADANAIDKTDNTLMSEDNWTVV